MSTYTKANWSYYFLIVAELALVAALVSSTDLPKQFISAAMAVGLIVVALNYPRCRNCGKSPWFRKVSADKWYAVAEYVPFGPPEKSCSRCGADLTKDSP